MLDCADIKVRDLAERYLLDALDESDRRIYEEHFFNCQRCFAELQMLATLSEGLRLDEGDLVSEAKKRTLIPWILAAMVVVVLGASFGAAIWLGSRQPPPSGSALAGLSASDRSVIEDFARLEAVSYESLRMRGIGNDARSKFRAGMEHYAAGEFVAARGVLADARDLDPDAPDIAFYLGVTQLMTGERAEGTQTLESTVAMGDTAFLEDALLYLARASWAEDDWAGTRSNLERVVALEGDREDLARRPLEILRRLE
jgi:hypothetical protein